MRRRAHDGGGGRRTANPRPFHHSLFGEWSPFPVNGEGSYFRGRTASENATMSSSCGSIPYMMCAPFTLRWT